MVAHPRDCHSKSIEERLTLVERELAELKTRLPPEPKPENWIEKISGSMKDFPEFDEVLRLGKEFRDADRLKDDDDGASDDEVE